MAYSDEKARKEIAKAIAAASARAARKVRLNTWRKEAAAVQAAREAEFRAWRNAQPQGTRPAPNTISITENKNA
ncbi:hypothetical protein [Bosea thiooxidans]